MIDNIPIKNPSGVTIGMGKVDGNTLMVQITDPGSIRMIQQGMPCPFVSSGYQIDPDTAARCKATIPGEEVD